MANTSGAGDDVLTAVGPRLRTLRSSRDITLTDLAATTGISVSTLSRLESGQRRPTLELLLPLARAYGVSLDELVAMPRAADPRVHAEAVVRGGMTFLPLTRRPGAPMAYKVVIPPRTPAHPRRQPPHEGYDWVYVLSGSLRLMLGEHDLDLSPGEAAEFDTRVPHAMANVTGRPVELLALFGPQGERMHVRARPVR